MSLDDPSSYLTYDEDVEIAATRLESALHIERLQDEMRRVKKALSYQAFADRIPPIVTDYARNFPIGGNLSSQNIYDFLKLKNPSVPNRTRRLAFHAFMMVVDETYREKWNYAHFVRRAGMTLTEFFATSRESEPYDHAINLQQAGGLFQYRLSDLMASSITKLGFQWRGLLLSPAKDLPFLLAYDFDVLAPPGDDALEGQGLTDEQIAYIRESWDLDARVGFYIPKRSYREGIVMLNSYKWDWPTIYNAVLNYHKDPMVDYFGPQVSDILLSDGNSFYNVERAEKAYLMTDIETPDDRKLMAVRQSSPPENLTHLTSLLERKFDWGAEL